MTLYLDIISFIGLLIVTLYYIRLKSYRGKKIGLIIVSLLQGIILSNAIFSNQFGFIYSVEFSVIYYIVFTYLWLIFELTKKVNLVEYQNTNINQFISNVIKGKNKKIEVKKYTGKNSLNAFAKPTKKNHQIILGEDLINRFNNNELKGILAHEISHILKRHGLKKFLLIIPIIILIAFSVEVNLFIVLFVIETGVFIYMLFYWISIISFFTISIILLNFFSWIIEYSADKNALKITREINSLKSAFEKIDKINQDKDYGIFLNLLLYDHPLIKSRIKKLEALQNQLV